MGMGGMSGMGMGGMSGMGMGMGGMSGMDAKKKTWQPPTEEKKTN